jgi:hypothetical protein
MPEAHRKSKPAKGHNQPLPDGSLSDQSLYKVGDSREVASPLFDFFLGKPAVHQDGKFSGHN